MKQDNQYRDSDECNTIVERTKSGVLDADVKAAIARFIVIFLF